MTTITVRSGHSVNIIHPELSTFTIRGIAHSLAHMCMFTGQSQDFYSVAQHSVLVSHEVPKEYALHGLLLDAADAFLGNPSEPMKALWPDYPTLKEQVQHAIFSKFGLPGTIPQAVKYYDLVLRETERRDLISSQTEWRGIAKDIQPLDKRISSWFPSEARRHFLSRFKALTENSGLIQPVIREHVSQY